MQEVDVVSQVSDYAHIVLDKGDGEFLVGDELSDKIYHLFGHGRGKSRGGLVQEKKSGTEGNDAGESEELLLTVGELAGWLIGFVGQAYKVQPGHGALAAVFFPGLPEPPG